MDKILMQRLNDDASLEIQNVKRDLQAYLKDKSAKYQVPELVLDSYYQRKTDKDTQDENKVLAQLSQEPSTKTPVRNSESIKAISNAFLTKYQPVCVNSQLKIYDSIKGYFCDINRYYASHLLLKLANNDLDFSKSDRLEALEYIKTSCFIAPENVQFNKDVHLINCRDGIYDTVADRIMSHDPSYLFDYVLDIKLKKGTKMKNFKRYINVVTCGVKEKELLLQEVLGYCLSNYFNAKSAFLLLGVPNSGKSTILRLLQYIVGTSNVSTVSLASLNRQFELSAMYGKRLNICGEISTDEIKDFARFKQITGLDSVNIEFKGQTPFAARLLTKFIFAGNNVPIIRNEAYVNAIYDRFVLVFFGYSIPRKDTDSNMDNKLIKERHAIFKWAMQGLRRLRANNWVFTVDPESMHEKEKRMGGSQSLTFFERDCVIYEAGTFTSSADLELAYKTFCERNGYHPKDIKEIHNFFVGSGKAISYRKNVELKKLRGLMGIRLIYGDPPFIEE